jgi:hypothetical protein
MEASWAEPCWVYDEPLLRYHLRRPSVDRDLLLGLESESNGELVAYYAFMPLQLRVGGEERKAVFGSFLTAASEVRRRGAAQAVQVQLLEEALARSYEDFLAFCEVGAASNESVARSCARLGLKTRTLATIPYLALPAAAVGRRTLPASGAIRTYRSDDANDVAALLPPRAPVTIEARHDRRDYDARFGAPLARTYVLPTHHGLAAAAHFVLLNVRDTGRRFRNAYLRDFSTGSLGESGQRQFLSDVLRAVAAEGCTLVVIPSCVTFPLGLLADLGFRHTSLRLNLLATHLCPERQATVAPVEFLLDVF